MKNLLRKVIIFVFMNVIILINSIIFYPEVAMCDDEWPVYPNVRIEKSVSNVNL
ncbi:hypothetical protein [Caloranaerobacter ferrireducens]|uniref:hypothetical protein n=1 Tax=Caloranaerobacter ferrireducens TaxID=1323370 RepID=UPI00159F03E7|nr:hypothetical protein [Caloranaerobacter ferrireducens]